MVDDLIWSFTNNAGAPPAAEEMNFSHQRYKLRRGTRCFLIGVLLLEWLLRR